MEVRIIANYHVFIYFFKNMRKYNIFVIIIKIFKNKN